MLTRSLLAELFQASVPNVSMHIRNAFADGELQEGSVVQVFLTTAADGKSYATRHYNAALQFPLFVDVLKKQAEPDSLDLNRTPILSILSRIGARGVGHPTAARASHKELLSVRQEGMHSVQRRVDSYNPEPSPFFATRRCPRCRTVR